MVSTCKQPLSVEGGCIGYDGKQLTCTDDVARSRKELLALLPVRGRRDPNDEHGTRCCTRDNLASRVIALTR